MCVIAFCHNIHRHHIQVQPIRARRVIFDEFQEIIQNIKMLTSVRHTLSFK